MLLYMLLVLSVYIARSQSQIDYKNTYAVIAGVLQWKDKSLTEFSDVNRKDQELYDQLIKMGVPKANIVLLLDANATAKAMRSAISQQITKCNDKGNFLFYYAGHGKKLQGGITYFLNYDFADDPANDFEVNYLSNTINQFFHGKNIFLFADCCYSGALLNECNAIKVKDASVYTLSSATFSNTSTANWTFTQTLLDGLRGEPLADRDGNGSITYAELSKELKDAMKYRERQLSGAGINNGDTNMIVASVPTNKLVKETKKVAPFGVGNYVIAWNKTEWQPARIVELVSDKYLCEFYDYSDKEQLLLTLRDLKSYYFFKYPVGTTLQVESEGKYYPAKVIKVYNDFHYIHYADFDDYWDEWVLYDRIKIKAEKSIQAKYDNTYYPAKILEKKGRKYFVHYDNYSCLWDEWLEEDKIKR